jgi:hypothetical protein
VSFDNSGGVKAIARGRNINIDFGAEFITATGASTFYYF